MGFRRTLRTKACGTQSSDVFPLRGLLLQSETRRSLNLVPESHSFSRLVPSWRTDLGTAAALNQLFVEVFVEILMGMIVAGNTLQTVVEARLAWVCQVHACLVVLLRGCCRSCHHHIPVLQGTLPRLQTWIGPHCCALWMSDLAARAARAW